MSQIAVLENESDVVSDLEIRINLICSELDVSIEVAHKVDSLFDYKFYSNNYVTRSVEPAHSELLRSFLSLDSTSNQTLCPFIDIEYLRDFLAAEKGDADSENWTPARMVADWLTTYLDRFDPWPYFERAYYTENNPDVAESKYPPFLHFVDHGASEGRDPSSQFHSLLSQYLVGVHPIDYHKMLNGIPYEYQSRFLDDETLGELSRLFMADVYIAGDHGENIPSIDSAFGHFLLNGASNKIRPSVLFNRDCYIQRCERYDQQNNSDASTGENTHKNLTTSALHIFPYLHWFFDGKEREVIPTPLFDVDIYSSENADVAAKYSNGIFSHYIVSGLFEKFRKHSNYFDPLYYSKQLGNQRHKSALVDYVLRGQFEGLLPCRDVDISSFNVTDPIQSSLAEVIAMYFNRKIDKLSTGRLKELVDHAKSMEPQIVRPYGRRHIRYAPLIHPEVPLFSAARKVYEQLQSKSYEAIVLIPHCRMAGSARIAGEFSRSVASHINPEKVLIINTDASHFERKDWFPESAHYLDLSKDIDHLNSRMKVRLLLCLLYTSPSPRDATLSRMPSSA